MSSQFSRFLLHGGFPSIWPTCSSEWACPWPFHAPKGSPSSSPLSRTVPSLWPKGRLSLKSSSCPHGPSESKTKRRKKRKWTFSHAFWTSGTQFPGSSGQKDRLIFQLPAPPASLALQRVCCSVPFTHDSKGGGDLPPYSPARIFLVFWLKRWNSPWFLAIVDTDLLRACLRVKTGEKKKALRNSHPCSRVQGASPGLHPQHHLPALLCLSKSSSNPSTVSGCTQRHRLYRGVSSRLSCCCLWRRQRSRPLKLWDIPHTWAEGRPASHFPLDSITRGKRTPTLSLIKPWHSCTFLTLLRSHGLSDTLKNTRKKTQTSWPLEHCPILLTL